MKAKISLIVFISFLIFDNALIAQSQEYISGYMVSLNQDTIHGFIKDEKRNVLSERFLFKKTLMSAPQEMKTSSATAFHMIPHFYFESVDFKKDGVEKKHFLRKLVAGDAALYQYFSNPVFEYVLTKGKEAIQISKKDSLTIEGVLKDNKYIGKIKYLLRACPSIVNAKKLQFGEKALIKTVTEYNNYVNPSATKNLVTKRKLKVKLGLIAGLRFYNKSVSSAQPPNVAYKDNKLGFQIGGMLNLAYFRKIALQLGVLYTPYSAQNTTTNFLGTITVSSEITNLEFPLQLKYNLSTKKLSPYLYGGIRIGKLLDSKVRRVRSQDGMQLSDDNYEFEFTDNFGFDLGTGISINVANKLPIQIELGYSRQIMRLSLAEVISLNGLNLNTKVFF